MIINRHNYEEFFLLYVDNELSAAERVAVEAFVEQNPDLEEELVMMMQSVLRPDNNVVFTNKESLLKNIPADGLVNQTNYEEYFVLYGDNELNNEEKDLVEQFVYKHPQFQAEFELIQQARLIPDHASIYPDKNELYRTEADDRVIPMRWWKIAAAAIVFIMLSVAGWYLVSNKQPAGTTPEMASAEQKNDTNAKRNTVSPVVKENGQVASTENKDKQQETAVKKDAPVAIDKNIANVNDKKNIPVNSNIERKKNVTQKSISESMAQDKMIEKKVEENPLRVNETEPRVTKSRVVSANIVDEIPNKPITIGAVAALHKPTGIDLNNPTKVKIYIDETSTEEDLKSTEASTNKKSVRGLFKKVKGLLDSSVEEDAVPDNKKRVSIAAFGIALK